MRRLATYGIRDPSKDYARLSLKPCRDDSEISSNSYQADLQIRFDRHNEGNPHRV